MSWQAAGSNKFVGDDPGLQLHVATARADVSAQVVDVTVVKRSIDLLPWIEIHSMPGRVCATGDMVDTAH